MAKLMNLVYLNLDNCPLKQSLTETYNDGISTMHSELRRKDDRKMYKEKLFDKLTEWIYPSQPKEAIFEQIELIF